jgi:hypothetical protein
MQTVTHDTSFADTITTVRLGGSKRAIWTGRILSGLSTAFLIFDSIGKLLLVQPVIEGTASLGYPVSVIVPIGVVELFCVLVYLIPRTAVPGAVLLTGYLGGAIATHVRVGSPLFSHVLFPTYVAAFLWGGLLLRDRRLRAFLRPRRSK